MKTNIYLSVHIEAQFENQIQRAEYLLLRVQRFNGFEYGKPCTNNAPGVGDMLRTLKIYGDKHETLNAVCGTR